MVFVGQAKRGQSPGVFQVRIERKGVVFDGQGSAVTENFHGPREIVRQGSLEVFAPAGGLGWNTSEGKRDRGEIITGIESAATVKAHFFVIEFVEIVKHAADAISFVVVEQTLVNAGDRAAAVEHQVLAD